MLRLIWLCVCVIACRQCMEVLHTWGPDIFHLTEVANGNPLTPVTYTILKVSDIARERAAN